MNLNQWLETDRAALQSFYEAGQAWSWAEIEQASSTRGRSTRDWIEACPAPRSHPLILPALHTDGRSEWFAIAFSDAQGEELREHLNAFLGPVGSDYNGQRSVLAAGNMLHAVVEGWAGGHRVYRFSPLPQCEAQVRGALNRIRQVWRLRPETERAPLRTREAMLREFFTALVNADENESGHWLNQLRLSGQLSAENLHFLQVERQGALGQWTDILLDARLDMLMAMRRPQRISGLLVEAVWRSELAGFVQDSRVVEALEHTRAHVLPRYGALLKTRGSLTQPPVVLAFLAAAVASSPPRTEQIPLLLAALPADSPDWRFGTALTGLLSPPAIPAKGEPLELAKGCMVSEDFDSAWLHLQKAVPSVASCALRLDCIVELLSSEVARDMADAMAQLSPDERGQVLKLRSRARTWQEVEEMLAAGSIKRPANWEAWLEAVERDPTWREALEAAQQGVAEWPHEIYLRNPGRVSEFATRLISTRSDEASLLVRLALPHMAQFFLDEALEKTAFLPVYQNLLWLLATDRCFGGQDWLLAQNLGLAILDSGAPAMNCNETLGLLTSIWQDRGDVSHLDWALDLLDTLVVIRVLATEARDAFFTAVWRTINENARRITGDHRQLFKFLCTDLGREAEYAALSFPDEGGAVAKVEDWTEALQSKLVAIYTLTESAGLRAKQLLESICTSVDVRLNHDHGGSDRLRSLAREADYFLIVTRSAKHSATEFIKSTRPRNMREVIYPTGKGSSSLISALRAVIES